MCQGNEMTVLYLVNLSTMTSMVSFLRFWKSFNNIHADNMPSMIRIKVVGAALGKEQFQIYSFGRYHSLEPIF